MGSLKKKARNFMKNLNPKSFILLMIGIGVFWAYWALYIVLIMSNLNAIVNANSAAGSTVTVGQIVFQVVFFFIIAVGVALMFFLLVMHHRKKPMGNGYMIALLSVAAAAALVMLIILFAYGNIYALIAIAGLGCAIAGAAMQISRATPDVTPPVRYSPYGFNPYQGNPYGNPYQNPNQNPYGNPYQNPNQNPYGQNPYNPYQQNPYGQGNPYGQNPRQNPYGQNPYNPYQQPYVNPYAPNFNPFAPNQAPGQPQDPAAAHIFGNEYSGQPNPQTGAVPQSDAQAAAPQAGTNAPDGGAGNAENPPWNDEDKK